MSQTTKQHRRITVVVNGESWGTYETRTGGEGTATVTKRRGGGMGAERSWGGLPTTSDVVVGRPFDIELELARHQRARRERWIGKVRVVVTDQYLDENGNDFGDPDVFRGRLQGITPTEADSTSSEPGMSTLTISTETA